MKQKSILFSMLTMLLVAVLSVSFTSCSSDDDDDEEETGNTSIVGSWIYYDDSNTNDCEYMVFVFRNDGTGYIYEGWIYDGIDEKDDDDTPFSYRMTSANTGVIESEEGKGTFELKDGKLYITANGATLIFIRQ